MLLCCWWCLRPEGVELESRRVDHRVLSCEAPASTTIAAVSFDQWEPETANTALPTSQRSADRCISGKTDLKVLIDCLGGFSLCVCVSVFVCVRAGCGGVPS